MYQISNLFVRTFGQLMQTKTALRNRNTEALCAWPPARRSLRKIQFWIRLQHWSFVFASYFVNNREFHFEHVQGGRRFSWSKKSWSAHRRFREKILISGWRCESWNCLGPCFTNLSLSVFILCKLWKFVNVVECVRDIFVIVPCLCKYEIHSCSRKWTTHRSFFLILDINNACCHRFQIQKLPRIGTHLQFLIFKRKCYWQRAEVKYWDRPIIYSTKIDFHGILPKLIFCIIENLKYCKHFCRESIRTYFKSEKNLRRRKVVWNKFLA